MPPNSAHSRETGPSLLALIRLVESTTWDDRRPSLKHLYPSPTVSAREFTAFLVGAARRESRVHPQGLCAEDHCGARDPVFVRRLALAIGLIAGLLGSQGPEFSQQYRQRIGGALNELKRIVTEFDDEAAREGSER
jgi:hypothetical protein